MNSAMLVSHLNGSRGAPLIDIVWGSIGAFVFVATLMILARLYASGKAGFLDQSAAAVQRLFPTRDADVALTTVIAMLALISAMFGFYWDVATHIDNGRDPGPFSNPSHWPIFIGLAGIFFAGAVGFIMGGRRPGNIALLVTSATSLAAFPLDDSWHRLFGQDVTVWGPTHVLMIGGAALAPLALWMLNAGQLAKSKAGWIGEMRLAAAWLIGMSALLAEFDFGVPQFRLVLHPILLAIIGTLALVTVRSRLGAGSALVTVAVFIVIRGLTALSVHGAFNHTTPKFSLYIASALLVELIALAIPTNRAAFGVACGFAIATIGTGFEWWWSHAWLTLPWTQQTVVEALPFAIIGAISAGILGVRVARLLNPDANRSGSSMPIGIATLVIAATIALCIPMTSPNSVKAHIMIDRTHAPKGYGYVTVKLEPATAAVDARWIDINAWQGGGLIVEPLVRAREGLPFTTKSPVPISGDWKTMLRLHRDDSLLATEIYMPADPAIPAKEIPALKESSRNLVADSEVLRREEVGGSKSVKVAGYWGLALLAFVWIATFGWALTRRDTREPERTSILVA